MRLAPRRLGFGTAWLIAGALWALPIGARSAPAAPDALADCEKALREAPDAFRSYRCFYESGRRHAPERAEARLRELALSSPWARLLLGYAASAKRDWDQATRDYAQAAAEFAAEGVPLGEVLARTNLWTLHFYSGDRARAEHQVAEARRAGESSEDAQVQVRAWLLEASHRIYYADELSLARQLLLRARARVLGSDPAERPALTPEVLRGLQVEVLDRLAALHSVLGRFESAVRDLREMQEVDPDKASDPSVLFRTAMAQLGAQERVTRPSDRDELVALLERAVQGAQGLGKKEIEARASALLGALTQNSNPIAATRGLARCAELAAELDLATLSMECHVWRAEFDPALTPAQAESELAAALALDADANYDLSRAHAWEAWLRVLWRSRPPARAKQESSRALDALDELRLAQRDEARRARLFDRVTQRGYAWLVGRVLQESPPDLDFAFDVIERGRGRSLLESLSVHRGAAGSFPEAPEPEAPEARAITLVQRQLASPELEPTARRQLLARLEQLEAAQETRRAAAQARARALTPVRPARLASLQAALEPDQALLLFQVGLREDVYGGPGGGAWLFAIAKSRVEVIEIPDRRELEHAVPIFAGLIERRDGAERGPAAQLGERLLEDALERLGPQMRRLVLVPDGVLHQLPFAALQVEGQPLAEQFELSVAPSASLWLHWQRQPVPTRDRPALIFADPARDEPAELASAGLRGGSLSRGLRLGPLPGARREGREVEQRLGEGSELRLGASASEAALKTAPLHRFGLLHVAAHAVSDSVQARRSFVLLGGDQSEDGLLQPEEIRDLDLQGTVVVLSACQGVAGERVGNEGVFSLGRAFLSAGAPALIGSLWPLSDHEAVWLFGAFYKQLAAGETLSAALLEVRREAISEGLPTHAWAGLVLLGNPDLRLRSAPQRNPALPWAVALVSACFCLWPALRAARGRRER